MAIFKYLYLLLILFAAIEVSGQGENSICGNIESGQLTIPSYRFLVTDKDGRSLDNVRATGRLNITEGVWIKEGLLDGHWKDVNHNIGIPITFDLKGGVLISQEIAKVKIAHRQKGGVLGIGSGCWDRVNFFSFIFNDPQGNSGLFSFRFPNVKIKKFSLPDPKNVIKVPLKYDKSGKAIP